MKTFTLFAALFFSSMAFSQPVKNDSLDINYNMAYRDSLVLRLNSRLSADQGWAPHGFNTGLSWYVNKGASRLSLVCEAYRNPVAGDDTVATRYGFTYAVSGPNTSINVSLFNNDSFTNVSGLTGRIDINVKLK